MKVASRLEDTLYSPCCVLFRISQTLVMYGTIPIVLSFVFGALFLFLILIVALCSCLGKLHVGELQASATKCKIAGISKSIICEMSDERGLTLPEPPQEAGIGHGDNLHLGPCKLQQGLQLQQHVAEQECIHQGLACIAWGHHGHPKPNLAVPGKEDSPPSYLECVSSSNPSLPAHNGILQ